jgi:inhibitor of KinA sporulation pathway (predicted exonuclease)
MTDDGKTVYWLCSWGFYDKKQLTKDCLLHGIDTKWLQNHISIKHQYADIYGIDPCGMPEAMRKLGIPMDGTHHRGVDDAKNIGKIFKFIHPKLKF